MDGGIFGSVGKPFLCHDGDPDDTPAKREHRIQRYMNIANAPGPRLNIFTMKPYREGDLVVVADDVKD